MSYGYANKKYSSGYSTYSGISSPTLMDGAIVLQNTYAAGLVQFFQFHPKDSNIIASTISDGSVMFWNIDKTSNASKTILREKIADSLVSSCWGKDGSTLYSCDIFESSVFATTERGTIKVNEGAHKQPIHTIRFWEAKNAYVTASYDDTIKIWDIRSPPSAPFFTIQTQTQQSSMDIAKDTMAVVQCKCRGVSIFDLGLILRGSTRAQNILYVSFYAPTEHQISCVKICPDGKRVGFGTIDGTFFMKSFHVRELLKDLSFYESQARTQMGCMYLKNIHKKEGRKPTLFMVNDILVAPKKQYVIGTVGGDGKLHMFNTSTRTLIKKHDINKTIPVKKCAVNNEGSLLGVALGNDYSGGFQQFDRHMQPKFQVQKVKETFFSTYRQ